MSVKPAKNPIGRTNWERIKRYLSAYGIAVEERPVVFVDKVGDEYCAFAVLYIKEKRP